MDSKPFRVTQFFISGCPVCFLPTSASQLPLQFTHGVQVAALAPAFSMSFRLDSHS